MVPGLPDSMAETSEGCSSNDNTLALPSSGDAELQSLSPSSPALSTDPEVIFPSPPNSPIYLTDPASIDEQDSFDSTSTIEATWPFLKRFHPSLSDQHDPQNKWSITFAPSEKISFRRPTREPLPTLINFNFFPHSKMFSKTENFLLILLYI